MSRVKPIKPPTQLLPKEALLQMTMGLAVSRCIFAVAKLGIADLLTEGGKHCDELSEITQTDSGTLYRLLRALASKGIFIETAVKNFELTPIAACLQSHVSGSLREFIILRGEEEYACWGELMHSLETGASAFEKVHGMPRLHYLKTHPKEAQRYNRAMAGIATGNTDEMMVATYDFSSVNRLVVIGSGQASLLATILRQNPHIKSVLLENKNTLATSQRILDEQKVAHRCEMLSGNFLDAVPTQGDLYLLGIIHVLDDEKALKVLKNCYQSMLDQGRLLIVERLISSENTAWRVNFADLNMLLMTAGKIRTKDEFEQLFDAAGFILTQVIPNKSVMSLLEGQKVLNDEQTKK